MSQARTIIVLLFIVLILFVTVQDLGGNEFVSESTSVQPRVESSSALGNGVITFKKIGGYENE